MSKTKYDISALRTVGTFIRGRACSDTLFHVLSRAFDDPLATEERAVMPLAGGIMQHGYQCGMIWGSTLAAGARAYRLHGAGPRAEAKAIVAAQRIVESFRGLTGCVDCYDITELNKSSTTMEMITFFLIKGGTIGCFRMAARYAPVAFREINAAFAEEHVEASSSPVSCSALLARKMGASDLHATMAAGFAGGIGLSGGGCGALGAAIWLIGMNAIREGTGKLGNKDPRGLEAIERLVKCTDGEFECSAIVGRRFESLDDHADFLRGGGCSAVFDALSAK